MKIKITEALRDLFDDLTTGQKIGVAVFIFAALGLAIFGGSAISGYRIKRLETRVAEAKAEAARLETDAARKENAAAVYKQKIDYLEAQLGEIRTLAKTQDEELEKLNSGVRDFRSDVDRARGIRSIRTTADELCKRLAEVGHACD